MTGRLTGRRALVTGGASGIGAACCRAMGAEGADVVILDLPEAQSAGEELCAEITAAGSVATFVAADVRHPGVVAEVALFAVMPRLARRFRARSLFLACFALTALRWLMIAAGAGNFALLLVAQGLHAASFGLYHAVAVQCVHDGFRGPLQGRGQALYSSVGFGAGGALGSFGAGLVWASAGPRAAWLVAAAVALLGLLVVWRSGAGRLESEPA